MSRNEFKRKVYERMQSISHMSDEELKSYIDRDPDGWIEDGFQGMIDEEAEGSPYALKHGLNPLIAMLSLEL